MRRGRLGLRLRRKPLGALLDKVRVGVRVRVRVRIRVRIRVRVRAKVDVEVVPGYG